MKEIKITTAKMKELHDGLFGCPEAQNAIKNAFPEAFKEKKKEWKKITEEIKIKRSFDFRKDCGFFFEYKGNIVFWGTIKAFDKNAMNDTEFKVENGEIYIRGK